MSSAVARSLTFQEVTTTARAPARKKDAMQGRVDEREGWCSFWMALLAKGESQR